MTISFFLKISLAFRCARIEGLDGSEGILIFGREHFYILEGYTYNTEKNEIIFSNQFLQDGNNLT